MIAARCGRIPPYSVVGRDAFRAVQHLPNSPAPHGDLSNEPIIKVSPWHPPRGYVRSHWGARGAPLVRSRPGVVRSQCPRRVPHRQICHIKGQQRPDLTVASLRQGQPRVGLTVARLDGRLLYFDLAVSWRCPFDTVGQPS